MLKTQYPTRRRRLDGGVLMERMAGKTAALRRFGRQSSITNAPYGSVDAFRIVPPPEGKVRVRNLIHRGAVRPVFKVPSLKLQRAVQCESLLEVDLALLLDVSPFVTSYGEQPVTFHFVIDGEKRWHVPDFMVKQAGIRIYIEVKFEKDVDDYVRARTALLQRLLQREGDTYLLLTEVDIRRPNWVSNARGVLRRACHSIPEMDLLICFERLRAGQSMTLRDCSWDRSHESHAIAVARLLVSGSAYVDMALPLTLETKVYTAKKMEGESWPLALSE